MVKKMFLDYYLMSGYTGLILGLPLTTIFILINLSTNLSINRLI